MSLGYDGIHTELLAGAGFLQRGTLEEYRQPVSAQRFHLTPELIRIAVRQDHEAQRFGQLRNNLAEKVGDMPAKLDADSVSAVVGQPCEGFSGYLGIPGVFEIQHPGLARPACSDRQG